MIKQNFNRLEVIDHTNTGSGRDYVKWVEQPFKVEFQQQDDDRTLKIFLSQQPPTGLNKEKK